MQNELSLGTTNNNFTSPNHLKDFVFFQLCFGLVSVLFMLLPSGLSIGWRLFVLVCIYNVVFPLFAYLRRQQDLLKMWMFLLPLSILQVFPDWFLSSELKILVFPPDGFYKIGTVSGYMAGLWVIPLFLVLYFSVWVEQKYNLFTAYCMAGILALMIFGCSEATSKTVLSSWYAQNVKMIGDMALYVLPAEVVLGVATFEAFQRTKDKSFFAKLIAAFAVMLIYTGSLIFFYFFVERF